MKPSLRFYAVALIAVTLAGCATPRKPPSITLDEPVQAQPLPEPPLPMEVVAVPEPLPLPGQLMPLPELAETEVTPEPADERVPVSRAPEAARMAPPRAGHTNALQVRAFTHGA